MTWVFLGLAYLMGAVPTSLWVGRLAFGVDLRREGSGNLGATNTFRVLGAPAAVPVLIFDIAKGFVPTWAFAAWAGVGDVFGWTLAFGAAAIFGHVFSLFAGFRGGKGVATSAGVFTALAPAAVGICFAAFWLVVLTTRIVSLGSITAAVLLPIGIFFTPHRGGDGLVLFALALSGFVIWAHRANIGRLLRGEENRFGRSAKGPGEAEGPAGAETPELAADPTSADARPGGPS